MNKSIITSLAALVAAVLCLSSCSENNKETEEFPDWQNTNGQFFDNTFYAAQKSVSNGDKKWKVIKKWSLEGQAAVHTYDHIVVEVLDSVPGAPGCPMYTDSVRVHYRGQLLPSTSYPQGYVFDQSYQGDFNPNTAIPSTMYVGGVVDGFATALQNMHVGDYWRVYIPYQLGYGVSDYTGSGSSVQIPGYSTLIFDIRLVAYYRPDADVPPFKSVTRHKSGRWIGLSSVR